MFISITGLHKNFFSYKELDVSKTVDIDIHQQLDDNTQWTTWTYCTCMCLVIHNGIHFWQDQHRWNTFEHDVKERNRGLLNIIVNIGYLRAWLDLSREFSHIKWYVF